MSKEDRSDWVAVAPEHTSTFTKIREPTTAFQFFMKDKDVSDEVKSEIISQHGKFEVGVYSRAMRDRWNDASAEKREDYEEMARKDKFRWQQESHAADVAALERRKRLQEERSTLMLDDEGGDRRSTRGQWKKKERKRERKEKKKGKREKRPPKKSFGEDEDDEDFVEDDEESSDSYSEESDDDDSDSFDSDDSDVPKRKKVKKKPPVKRPQSQKQIEYRQKMQREKKEKEDYIVERQEDLRKEKAAQAKRRLEFLLKQSNIFSHFGQVKQDQAKYGIKATPATSEGPPGSSRHQALETDDRTEQELDEADEHQATFLTSQPSTLAFGKMRQYQLEGLNWMIRLQENGVNGILADEVRCYCVCVCVCVCVCRMLAPVSGSGLRVVRL